MTKNNTWHLWGHEEPQNNTRCVGLYSDGSGSVIFTVDNEGGIYKPDTGLMSIEYFDECILYWAYLPSDYKLWKEKD